MCSLGMKNTWSWNKIVLLSMAHSREIKMNFQIAYVSDYMNDTGESAMMQVIYGCENVWPVAPKLQRPRNDEVAAIECSSELARSAIARLMMKELAGPRSLLNLQHRARWINFRDEQFPWKALCLRGCFSIAIIQILNFCLIYEEDNFFWIILCSKE